MHVRIFYATCDAVHELHGVFSLECKRDGDMVKQKVISAGARMSCVVHHAPCVVFTPLVVSPLIMSSSRNVRTVARHEPRHSRPQSRV